MVFKIVVAVEVWARGGMWEGAACGTSRATKGVFSLANCQSPLMVLPRPVFLSWHSGMAPCVDFVVYDVVDIHNENAATVDLGGVLGAQ